MLSQYRDVPSKECAYTYVREEATITTAKSKRPTPNTAYGI